MLPYGGEKISIVQWNADTNRIQEYCQFPQGFQCMDPVLNKRCMESPFSSGAISGDCLYLTPDCVNMYIKLDITTGEMTEWRPSQSENYIGLTL